MYYRGDDFGANPQLTPDLPVDLGPDLQPIQGYANTPDSEIRKQELATGRDVAASGFTGGGGFLKELAETGLAMAAFYAPFAPVILPALAALPGASIATTAYKTAGLLGGALRTIEGITTAPAATITGREVTSGTPSAAGSTVPQLPPSTLSTPQAAGGLDKPLGTSDWAWLGSPGPAPRRSRRTPRSPRLSRTQQKALSAAVRRQLQL